MTKSWSPWGGLILSLVTSVLAIFGVHHQEGRCWPTILAGGIEGILTNALEWLVVRHMKLTCTVLLHCPKALTDFQTQSRWPRQSHWTQHNHRVKTWEVVASSGLPLGLVIQEREATWMTLLSVGLVTKTSLWHPASDVSGLTAFQWQQMRVTSNSTRGTLQLGSCLHSCDADTPLRIRSLVL